METAYKVVHTHGNSKLSAFTSNDSRTCVNYKPGEWAYAKVGKLFCFTDRKMAKLFAITTADYPNEIWLAEVLDPEEPHFEAWTGRAPTVAKYLKSIWSAKRKRKLTSLSIFFDRYGSPPGGTIICTGVKLLKQV